MRRFLLMMFVFTGVLVAAQNKGTGPSEKSMKDDLRVRKQIKKERKEKRKLEKAERKAIEKHHKRIQTKDVQKRMKKSRKTSYRNNENKREFFMKRWFTKRSKRAPAKKKD
jgi:uncharacterized protein YlxW (UPF0749 family)